MCRIGDLNRHVKPMIESGEYLLVLGTLALLNAGLAQSKGQNEITWLMLSLLIGPIATFILVFVL